MTRRFYTTCPECHAKLRKVADGEEGETIRYYVCPGCGRGWTFLIDRNFLQRGIPENLEPTAQSLLD